MAASKNEQALAIRTVQTDLEKLLPALNQALPETIKKYLTPERVVKVAMLAIRKSPLLAQCSKESILQCVMDSASLGLDVGGMLGHAYLVPFKNNKKGIYESQLVIGYKGFINLARRSGEVLSVKAEVVYENDEFDVDLASGDLPKHKPFLKGDRGKPYLVYCVARFRDGGNHTEVMTLSDCEKIRMRSRAKDAGPWANKDDYLEMCKKTCTRRAAKYWPLASDTANDISHAVEVDAKTEVSSDAEDIITAAYSVVPEAEEAPPSRTDEVLAKITQQDNPKTGETSWENDQAAPAAPEELLAYVRTRWCEVSPDAKGDKDILRALKGVGIERDSVGKCSEAELKKLLATFDRQAPEAAKK